jgi:hypothetical protein
MATPVANAAKLLRNSRASNIGAIRICILRPLREQVRPVI